MMAGRAKADFCILASAVGALFTFGMIGWPGAASADVYPRQPVQRSDAPWHKRAAEADVHMAVRALDRLKPPAAAVAAQPKADIAVAAPAAARPGADLAIAAPAAVVQPKADFSVAAPAAVTVPVVVPKPKAVAGEARPRIAVVIDDLGLNGPRARRFIELDGPLTLAFLPYGYDLPRLTSAAASRGHEIFLHLPMEPMGGENPGPDALLENLGPAEFERRLVWAFEQVDGIRGFNNHMGSRLTANPLAMQRVMAEARRRNLLFLDSRTSGRSVAYATAMAYGVAAETRDIFLDHDPSAENVARQLAKAENVARRKGHAIVIGHPYDTTYSVLKEWIADARARGFELAPVSVLIEEAGVPMVATAGALSQGSHGASPSSVQHGAE